MSLYDKMEKFALQWAASCKEESFLLDDLADACTAELHPEGEELERTPARLRNILDASDDLLRPHSSDRFYLLEKFMHGLSFFCRPRKFEIEEGILIAGMRFEPFHPDTLFYDDLSILAPEKIPTRSYECTYGKAGELYYLLGPAAALDILNAESPENYERMERAGGLREGVTIVQEVFDFREFYERHSFREGDEIRFTIDSYLNGQLRAEYVARPNAPSPAETDRFLTEYESALVKVCRDYKDSLEIPMQLMFAYIYAAEYGRDLRNMPAPPLDMYQVMMRDIGIRRNGLEWCLESLDGEEELPPEPESEEKEHEEHHGGSCSCHEKPASLTADDLVISKGSMDSIESILAEAKSPVGEIEVQAFMLDTLASGIDTFEEFERVNSDILNPAFADEAQEAAFRNCVEELWEQTAERYSMNLDSLKAPLRQRLLEKVRDRIGLVGELASLKDPELEKRFHGRLKESRRKIMETLGVLDSDDGIPDDEALGQMEERVGDLEADLEELTDDINEFIQEREKK